MDFFHLNLEILNVNKSFVYALLYFSRNFSGFSLKSSNSVSFQAMKMFSFFFKWGRILPEIDWYGYF